MNRSLQRHLSRTLALVILLAGLLAGVASFVFAYQDAQEFQDDMLHQVAAIAGRQGALRPYEGGVHLDDSEARIIVLRLPPDRPPDWLPPSLAPGLHTLAGAQDRWRVYVRDEAQGVRTVVAQATDVRDELAIGSALRTLIPLTLLLPLLAWLTARIVRGELGPVRRLAGILDATPPGRLEALPEASIPAELGSFVRAINRLLERVGRLMDDQRRFIADAAHELRSPLTALSVQAQNLEKADTIEAMRERVVPLREGIDRARRLTEQLLSLARTHAGSARLTEVDASRFARELIAEYLPIAEARGIDLGLDDPGVFTLVTEPESLRLVLRNALDNALSYTPASGEVTLRLRAEGDDAVIEVADSGPGIPTAQRDRVFEPFCRLDSDGTGEHSGLGLAIARDAAARLGGDVSLHDRPGGRGLLFRYRQRRSR
ncbi:MAG: ATP-binding protein [Casimicrobiaceae bacterium]